MPPVKFNSDLGEAQKTSIRGVSDVRRGHDPGTILFTYQHAQLDDSAAIQMIAHDEDAYPKNVEFLIIADVDPTGGELASWLDGVSTKRKWSNITEAIQAISAVLAAGIEKRDSSSSQNEDEEGLSWDEQSEFDGLDAMDISSPTAADQPELNEVNSDLSCRWDGQTLAELRISLKKAQASGMTVGIYPLRGTSLPQVISLSAPVASLGLTAGVLEAWGLKESDNLVLLIRMSYLPSLSEFLKLSSRQKTLAFRFGKCRGEKPSLASVQSAYGDLGISFDDNGTGPSDTELPFELIHMSNSLDRLLNSNFMKLLLFRREKHLSWEMAQCFLSQLEVTPAGDPVQAEIAFDTSAAQVNRMPLQTLQPPFSRDNALESPEEFSLPLVAMQLVLHRVANCTRYCMVCNARLFHNVQALKPYICDNSLCLFQYLSLGLGSSIEHEIINAPYVVDMLVSFLYTALASSTVRELPDGLQIKTAYIDEESANQGYATATADMVAMTLTDLDFPIAPGDAPLKQKLREGDRVIILHREPRKFPLTSPYVVKSWCRLISCIGREWKFERFHHVEELSNRVPSDGGSPPEESLSGQLGKGLYNVRVYGYWQNIDELDLEKRRSALLTILDGLPSILEMRQYLMLQPGRRLATWGRMNASELSVLNWTVASNRSMIIQDDAVPPGELQEDYIPPWTKVAFSHAGSDQWMQFRFVQGSPVSEQAFEKAVAELERTTNTPTLFAWHGSRQKNWHSIVRTGLDFSTMENGRACGNGVYFSSDMNTSLGYCGGVGRLPPGAPVRAVTTWAKSQLQISSAIAICELINRPDDYISNKPHFVVDVLDWIQCRYLLININSTKEARQFPFHRPLTSQTPGYVPQDDKYPLLAGASKERVHIPITALPHSRRLAQQSAPQDNAELSAGLPILSTEEQSSGIPRPQGMMDADASSQQDLSIPEQQQERLTYAADDVEFYLGAHVGDDAGSYSTGMKRLNSSTSDSSFVSQHSHKRARTMSDASVAARAPISEEPQSNGSVFDPRRLQMDSLRILTSPSWAGTSTRAARRLMLDMTALTKKQETDLSSGYYLQTENLGSNIFQWVVELFDFDSSLPLAGDMARFGCPSIVLELRFGPNYPMSPPFVRVIRPQLVPNARGGGGHVTEGGAVCLELLTDSGWNPAINIDNVLCQIRATIGEPDPPARIEARRVGTDYGLGESVNAFRRLAERHNWAVPADFGQLASW